MENKTSALFLWKLVWRTWPFSVATVRLPNTCFLRWTLSRIVSLPQDWTVEYSRMHCPTQQGVEPHMSISFSLAYQSYYTILFLVMMNKGMETRGRLVLSAHDLAEHWNENSFPLEMSRVVIQAFLNGKLSPTTTWNWILETILEPQGKSTSLLALWLALCRYLLKLLSCGNCEVTNRCCWSH